MATKRGSGKNSGGGRRRIPVLDSGNGGGTPPRAPRRKKPHGRFHRLRNRLAKWRKSVWRSVRKLVLPVGFVVVVFVAWFLLSLPNIDQLNQATRAPSVVIKSADGKILGSYGDIYGDYLQYRDLPQSLIDAVLATEDRNFFHHPGIDPKGLIRAMVVNARAGRAVQGGSTLTQQVAKNVFLTPERTLSRKLRETLLALKLEWRFRKEDIFAIYVNRVYLGAGNYGVDAASRRYFGKSARELTLSESAILAGLLKAPSRFAPTSNPQLARKRAEQVLINMQDAGFLTAPEVEKAKTELAQTISRTTHNNASSAMYFTDWVMDQLSEYVGTVSEDLVVTATLDLEMQRLAGQAMAEAMDKDGERLHASQAALVAMTPDGAVKALLGGREYGQSQYNRATQARRQPGSSFKLFVYLAGLESGLSPASLVIDQPVTVGKWQPRNYTGKYKGEIPLREAVAESINTVAVQVSEYAGRGNVVGMAHRLGVSSDIEPVPSIALGSTEATLLEMTGAYAHLASNGLSVEPYGILRIETAAGRTLYRYAPESRQQLLSDGTVAMMNGMLSGVMTSGTGRGAQIGRSAAGKTGTTSDYRDAWFIGYTPDLVTGVWVGNDDNSAMKKVTGGTLPAPIWREFMKAALAGTPARDLPVSTGFWQNLLPWQQSVPVLVPRGEGEEAPPESDAPHGAIPVRPLHPAQPAESESDDVQLGPDFWNKLMDSGEEGGHVRHEYPEQTRR